MELCEDLGYANVEAAKHAERRTMGIERMLKKIESEVDN